MTQPDGSQLIERAVRTYGLRANPFAQRPLDPLRRADDAELIAHVDGWRRKEELEQYLLSRIEARSAAIVIAAGGSGTGRSSLANFAMDVWRARHEIRPEQLVVAPWRVNNYDASDQLWRWALTISPLVLRAGLTLADKTEERLANLLEAKPAALGASLRNILQLVTRDLAQVEAKLVAVIEGVNEKEFLALGTESLEYVEMLMIMTVDRTRATEETVLSETGPLVDAGAAHLTELRELTGAEVCDLVQNRWRHYSDGVGSPFDNDGIRLAFDNPPRSLSRALKLVEFLLVMKAGQSQAARSREELALSAEEIERMIRYADGLLRVRGQ